MDEMFGKAFFNELTEIVAPDHTAVVLIDMQNDFCRQEGAWASRLGVDLRMMDTVIPNLMSFLDAARSSGSMIVHTQHTTLPGMLTESPARPRLRNREHTIVPDWRKAGWPLDFEYAVEGTWGQEFIDELRPIDGDIVIKKTRSSGFVNTNMGLVLRCNGIESLVIAGCITNGCVVSTALHASWLDFYTITVSDCVGTWDLDCHDAALSLLSTRPSAELLAAWAPVGA